MAFPALSAPSCATYGPREPDLKNSLRLNRAHLPVSSQRPALFREEEAPQYRPSITVFELG